MTLQQNQSGFSITHFLLVLLIIGALGFAGWRVYEARQEDNSPKKNSNDSTTQKEEPAEKEIYTVPDGYVIYENKEIGFKFAYPEQWGKLTPNTESEYDLDVEGPEIPLTSDGLNTSLRVFAAKVDSFRMSVRYKGRVIQRPEATGGTYVWKVAEAIDLPDVKVGEPYEFQPKVAFQLDGLVVYDFWTGHATATWHSWAFAVGDYFVGIEAPGYNMPLDDQAAGKKLKADNDAINQNLLRSIRIL